MSFPTSQRFDANGAQLLSTLRYKLYGIVNIRCRRLSWAEFNFYHVVATVY